LAFVTLNGAVVFSICRVWEGRLYVNVELGDWEASKFVVGGGEIEWVGEIVTFDFLWFCFARKFMVFEYKKLGF